MKQINILEMTRRAISTIVKSKTFVENFTKMPQTAKNTCSV